MSDTVIRVENLGKKYIIGHQQQERYTALRDVITNKVKSLGSLINPKAKNENPAFEEFWALKDVSFDIKQGDRVGIIGRNGAGKSTLLKILSRITEPTKGSIKIKGRVASLLEVGTGFHPELTGRENIFLNGAILGMGKEEIKRKFDEIVAFAEVEKFLDTPVKRYSSGMYVRLAFAVAAHLEPEILIVDEVLAVGDAQFQKKCLGKMEDVAEEGRTIIFVSHNMGVIQELVEEGMWLNQGRLNFNGNIKDAISKYLASGQIFNDSVVNLSDHPNRLPRMKKTLKKVICKTSDGVNQQDFTQSDDLDLEIEYQGENNLAGAGFIISTIEGIKVGGFNTYMAFHPPHNLPKTGKVQFNIPCKQLTPGTYCMTVSLGSHQGILEDKVENCLIFNIHPSDIYETGYLLTREDGVASLFVKAEVQSA
jgi:lipopolysaccharide transport system ATP-binding protein